MRESATDPVVDESTEAAAEESTDDSADADREPSVEPSVEPSDEAGSEPSESSLRIEQLEHEGDIAADYLEELLDIADVDGDLDMDVDGDRAAVSIVGGDLSALVGRDGEVLDALQELTRLAVYQQTGERSRLMLDVDGFRAAKKAAVVRIAEDAVKVVKESGEPQPLEPMTPFERKVVHDVVAEAGLTSESEGVEPKRHVVILPS